MSDHKGAGCQIYLAMISLRPTNLHWNNGSADDPADLCAHSPVEFRIHADVLVQPSDGDRTVSAAAVYLLRTLSQAHTKHTPVGEHLFPHCGHGIFAVEGQEDVTITGCNSGIDFEVVHVEKDVVLTATDGREHRITATDWKKAVCEFSDAVQAFYAASSQKEPSDEFDQQSFQKFLSEWSRRRTQAEDHLAS